MHRARPQAEAFGFSATVLLSGKTATGGEVPETAPRTVAVAPEFARALANDPAAHDFLNRLSRSDTQRFVRSIEEAKSDDTRQRRIAKAGAQLSEGRR